MFSAVLDSRTTPTCRACHGTILPASDPWWLTHVPPLHHNCRSAIVAISAGEAALYGVTTSPPSAGADDGWGEITGMEAWLPDAAGVPPALWAESKTKRRR